MSRKRQRNKECKRSCYEGQGKDKEKSFDRELRSMRNKDVQDFTVKEIDEAVFFRKKIQKCDESVSRRIFICRLKGKSLIKFKNMFKKEKRIVWIILAALFCFNILVWIGVYELSQPRFLEVIFFDVGQGDAIWIETPEKHQILIDGGPGSTILEKLAQEMPPHDRTIDLIILTHPEADHATGLIRVLERYKVENILWTGAEKETSLFEKWQEAVDDEEARIIIGQAGQIIKVGQSFLKVLNPLENLEKQQIKNINNTSIVVQLMFGEDSFLFTGDIYKDKENELAEKYELDSDILKISHHGSKTSTSQEFLNEVSPEIAIVSCGKENSYGHPHPDVMEKLQGIKVLRTDQDGDIKFSCNGKECLVKTSY